MLVEIHEYPMYPNPPGPVVWGAVVMTAANCAQYGQQSGCLVLRDASELLKPNTNYWLHVAAYDFDNWKFAACVDWPFTTGP